MALSLILRNVNKMQVTGYPGILRCTSIAFTNTGNFGNTSNRNSIFPSQKLTIAKLNEQVLKTPVRCMSGGGDHRMMWTIERVLSIGLIGILPAAIAYPSPMLDNIAAISMVLHFHWGLEAMAEDYMRPIVVGAALSKIALLAVYLISSATLGGLMYFNYTDIGLGQAIRKLWSINSC